MASVAPSLGLELNWQKTKEDSREDEPSTVIVLAGCSGWRVYLSWLPCPLNNSKLFCYLLLLCHHSRSYAKPRQPDLEVKNIYFNQAELVSYRKMGRMQVLVLGQLQREVYSKIDVLDQWCLRKLLGIIVQAECFSLFHIARMLDETRQEDFNSCPSGELQETTRTPSYYVDDYPTRAKIQKRPSKEAISVSQNCPLWSRATFVTKTRTTAHSSRFTKTRTVKRELWQFVKRKLQWEKRKREQTKNAMWFAQIFSLVCERKLASSSSTDSSLAVQCWWLVGWKQMNMDTWIVNCAGNLLEPFATPFDMLQTDIMAVTCYSSTSWLAVSPSCFSIM